MKRLLNIVALLCTCVTMALAAPARPIVRDLTLSDGTVVKNAVSCGNEFGHYWLAPDGTKYVEGEDGKTCRRAPLQGNPGTEQMRTVGVKNLAPRGLVILANFKDVKFRPMNTHAEIDSMLNGESYRYHKSYGSAKQYFHDQSNGDYVPQFDVVGPVELPDSLKYYGRNRSGKGTDVKGGDIVLKACSIASLIDGVDFSLYDNNNDNMLDFVYVIYAGYGESDSRIDSLIWPSTWTMGAAVSQGFTSLPTNAPKSAYTFQGKTITNYSYSSELNYYNTIYKPTPGYSDSIPLRSGIGVFCHEFGHLLGLPDYYDTSGGANFDNCLTPGNWDVMDQGCYNTDGYVPPVYSAHERWWMGWRAPVLLNDTAEVTLPADNSVSYYVTRNGTSALATTQDTVYYLENRQKTGWDIGLPGHGMLIWRVVYNSAVWSANVPNNTPDMPRYLEMAADSIYAYNPYLGLQGDDGDAFPGSANITHCRLFRSYPILDIREEAGEIHFSFMGKSEGSALPFVEEDSGINAVFSLTGTYMGNKTAGLPAGIYVIRKDTGKTEKIIVR